MTADVQPLDRPVRTDPAPGAAGPGAAAPGTASAGGRTATWASARSGTSIGWREAAGASAWLVRDRPGLIAVGLMGFLARGGLVLFLLPIVALPTPTGISNFLGGTALTGAGASEGLVRLIVAAVSLVIVLVLAGISVGAVADILLARQARALVVAREHGVVTDAGLAAAHRQAEREVRVTPTLVARIVVVRLVALLPVGLAVGWATARLVAAGYHQLILPDDLAVPLAIRILREALDATLVVLAVWLAAELVGGLAVRHAILARRSLSGAFLGAFGALLRRPFTTMATYLVGGLAFVVIALPTLLLAAALWSRLQALLADDIAIPLLVPATFVFVLVWGGGLAIVGGISAWRSVLLSVDVLRALPAGRRPDTVAAAAPAEGDGATAA